MAAKVIGARCGGPASRTCSARGRDNVHGEAQQKLDMIANEMLMARLGDRPSVSVVASEEHEQPTILRLESEGGKLLRDLRSARWLLQSRRLRRRGHDLLDLRHQPAVVDPVAALCQPGCQPAGRRLHPLRLVHGLRADDGQRRGHVRARSVDRLVRAGQRQDPFPPRGKTYSVNEAYCLGFPDGIRRYLAGRTAGYSSRYIGSMVADVHRMLLTGRRLHLPTDAGTPAASCG